MAADREQLLDGNDLGIVRICRNLEMHLNICWKPCNIKVCFFDAKMKFTK
jgi:hypothetical protein